MAHFFVDLAKTAVENYIKKGEIISPFIDLPKDVLTKKAGTFVTIMENPARNASPARNAASTAGWHSDAGEGNLRGCIGTYLPTEANIAEEIIHNAIAAATEDHRFHPIRKQDLSQLSYTVYILDELKLVKNLKELDPQKYGIIVKNAPIDGDFVPKSGLLLPDLKDIDTAEKQILIACQKGGIDINQDKILIYKFMAKKYQ